MIYHFGEYVLDIDLYELRRGEEIVWVEPQVFSLLTYLVEHHDRVVTREDLFTHLWPNRFIGNSALERCVMRARKAIGDTGGKQRVIKTFRSRGYRFLLPVTKSPTTTPLAVQSLPHHSPPYHSLREIVEPVTYRERQPPSAQQRRQVTVLSCALASAEMLADKYLHIIIFIRPGVKRGDMRRQSLPSRGKDISLILCRYLPLRLRITRR